MKIKIDVYEMLGWVLFSLILTCGFIILRDFLSGVNNPLIIVISTFITSGISIWFSIWFFDELAKV